MTIKHFSTCNPNYPEKSEDEGPQHIQKIDIDNNQTVHQCCDCGAFEIKETECQAK